MAGLSLSCIIMEAPGRHHRLPSFRTRRRKGSSPACNPALVVSRRSCCSSRLVGVIPPNAMNDNSAAYCLVSTGIRIPRPISAAIAGAPGYAFAVYGAAHLSGVIENVILLLFYWIAPWTAIILVHWFKTGMHEKKFEKGWTGATIFCAVTVLTAALFSSNDLYTGPIAKMRSVELDIGYYVGFFAAGTLLAGAASRSKKA